MAYVIFTTRFTEAKLLFYWIPDEIIVMDPYEMDIGFHDVDSTSAGMKHAIVVEPSGEYIFSLEQSYFQEAILNNRLHIMKEIIKYSYPIENLVLDCVMKTTADTCEGFRCTNMYELRIVRVVS
ncbi:hypothetical protein IscW_ISCW017098 [Ixodes scapularis]|uniref:Uncharacterized protein n=1 Tax=Ixodes scapularis TaxID=6945 RepID=B7P905_IXOSC|nr:hypothetical protein IscW_ISCW017098 [Ixodes scapularis]|eukprot:XP_002403482.1 hypothetical protein IscW_ISCW017098 [Ixodes scapularis]